MRFQNVTGKMDLKIPIEIANGLLEDGSKMIQEIRLKNDFKYDSGTGAGVRIAILALREPVRIFYYKPFNPWTAAVGYQDSNGIHINSRRQLSEIDLVGLFLHEYAHYCGYHHGNNYKTQEKCLYSVPYYLSEGVSRWI